MASVNKVILIGHLGRDPEVRYMPNGDPVCNVSLATSETWKDKATGEKQEATEWHNLIFYRKLAEIAGEYLKKGSPIYVEGSLRTRKWKDKDGRDRYTTEIRVAEMTMLGSKGGDRGSQDDRQQRRPADKGRQGGPTQQGGAKGSGFDEFDDDIPF